MSKSHKSRRRLFHCYRNVYDLLTDQDVNERRDICKVDHKIQITIRFELINSRTQHRDERRDIREVDYAIKVDICLLYTSPSPRDRG